MVFMVYFRCSTEGLLLNSICNLIGSLKKPIVVGMTNVVDHLLKKSYFSGYFEKKLTPELVINKKEQLSKTYDCSSYEMISSKTGKSIDHVHIKSQSEEKTGNAMIFVLNHQYQFFNRKNYEHLLNDGLDVVLFNPTELDFKTMDSDLKDLLNTLIEENPSMRPSVYGYCMGSHIAGNVASTYVINGKKEIPAIIDRGFLNTSELSKKINRLAEFSFVKKIINEKYDVGLKETISEHEGPLLLISCPQGKDQLMHRGSTINLTQDISDRHTKGETVNYEIDGDHWSLKDADTWNGIKGFLKEKGILHENYTKLTEEDFPKSKPGSCRSSRIVYKLFQ